MDTLCLHCDFPILDDECFQVKDQTSSDIGFIHIECHENYKDKQNRQRLGIIFVELMIEITGEHANDAQELILQKWRRTDDRKYDLSKMKKYKIEYESNGPNGIMMNDLLKNFTNHPNAIRIFIEVMFKASHLKDRAREGIELNKNNEMLFDLFLLETVKKILEGDRLVADKMLLAMIEIDREKTELVIISMIEKMIYNPIKVYKNSPITKILKSSDLDISLKLILALPNALDWPVIDFFDGMTAMDINSHKPKILMIIRKYQDDMNIWCRMSDSLFRRPEVYESIEFVSLIAGNTIDIIESARLLKEIETSHSNEDWSNRIEGLIRGHSIAAYNIVDRLDLLRKQFEETRHWDDGCANAFFKVLEPQMHEVLVDSRTIFDDFPDIE